jgi:hypothetical protein
MNEDRKLLPIKMDYEIMKILGIPNSTSIDTSQKSIKSIKNYGPN